MSTPKIAIILYSVREPAQQDLAGTLRRVREAGFEHVQWSGMPPMDAEAVRGALETAGLKAIAAHCPVEPFEKDFDAQVAYWQHIGINDVAPGGMMGDCIDTLDDWRRGAARLNTLGARLRERGMRLSYHNHHWEFVRYDDDDRYRFDILYEETAPNNLYMELDVGWAHVGGVDPAEYIRTYRGRCPLLHIKDFDDNDIQDNGMPMTVPVGAGNVDWPSVIAAAKEAGTEWLIYEQDWHKGDPIEDARISYDFLASHV